MRAVLLLALAAACAATKRPALEPAALAEQRAALLQTQHDDDDTRLEAALRRMERNPGPFDILVIHGGRDNGAFGAGFLDGWREARGELARPEFDIVTGVSSGALLAPFAILGDEAYDKRIHELHTRPAPDWVRLRGPFFWYPTKSSLMDMSKLRGLIRREIDEGVVTGIVEARQGDRMVLIGTTNIDHGEPRVWDLGRESRGLPLEEARDRIYSIVVASAALPVLFEPVLIDDQLYVDGAVTVAMFVPFDASETRALIDEWRERHPDRPVPKIRIWVIVNDRLAMDSEVTRLRYGDLGVRTVFTILCAQRLQSLREYDDLVTIVNAIEGVTCELRFVAIPDDYPDPGEKTELFHEERMRGLAKLGYEMGKDPSSWRTEPPR